MSLTRIDSAFLDLDALGGIDFDVQSGVPTFSVDAVNHRVGIGTDSPTTKLEVIGDITVSKQNAFIELKDPDTADANYQLKNTNGTFDIYDVTNNAVKIRATAGYVTIYPNLNANNGLDVMGTITGDSNLDIDGLVRAGNGTQAAPSHSFVNDTDNGMYRPAVNNIAFVTGGTERIRITSAGSVGIGTDDPAFQLSIYGTGSVRNEIVCTDSNAGGAGIYLKTLSGGSTVSNATLHTNSSGSLLIYTGTSSASERLRIDSSGNVGIGTNNPVAKLHVDGKAFFYRGIEITTLDSNEINTRSPINSGHYNINNPSISDGWPIEPSWVNLLATTHSNSTNYYSQQFVSSFFDQELYFRNTNAAGTTTSQSWGQVMHTNSTLKPVYAESDGSTADWSRYFYPGGEYYTAVHSGTGNDFNNFKEQGYYHVNNTASNAPTSGHGYLEIHRHQGSQYFTQKFTLSGDTSRTFFRRGSDSGGTQTFGVWNTYGALERENTFTNHQNFSGNNYLTFGPNSTWSNNLRIGGDGWQGNATTGTVCVTNGNLHIDAANESGHGVYLNWYGGTSGTYFGDGSSGLIAKLESDGRLFVGADNKTNPQVVINGQSNQLILKRSNSTSVSVIHRNDASHYFILLTNATASPSGVWNGLRPFFINLSTGKLHSTNGQEFTGGTKVFSSMNLANIELDFTTANNKYVDFYTNNGNTVNFRMPDNSNNFHTGIQMVRNSGVNLYHANSIKLYTTSNGVFCNGLYGSSDANLKENVVTVSGALDKVKAMRGVKFNWKKDGRADYGVIAQEAETVVPELVSENETKKLTQAGCLKKRPDDSDYITETQKGFSYSSMVGILIEAIKEQQATIDSLTARIDALESP